MCVPRGDMAVSYVDSFVVFSEITIYEQPAYSKLYSQAIHGTYDNECWQTTHPVVGENRVFGVRVTLHGDLMKAISVKKQEV